MNKHVKTVSVAFVSATIGAGLGILFAPKSGKETRKDLKKAINKFADKVKEIDAKDVKKHVLKKTNEIESALENLDKEKVLKSAKKKVQEIEKNATELVEYVKEKGETALIETANILNDKVIATTKSVLKKLEEKK